MSPRVQLASATHAGRRSYQQDDLVMEPLPEGALIAVADGMGGHAAGEVASRLVREALHAVTVNAELAREPAGALVEAAEAANGAILAQAHAHPETAGLGSTLVAAWLSGEVLTVGHAGDSRAYLVLEDDVVQLTKDHSAVQDALDHGTLTEDQVASFPYRNAILRHLGDTRFPGLDVSAGVEVGAGTVVLLTSDGAHGYLTPADFLEQLAGTPTLAVALENLARLAYHRGSDDNITLVACEVGEYARSRIQAQTPPPIRRRSGAH
jgi:PPM family protein phosphatase